MAAAAAAAAGGIPVHPNFRLWLTSEAHENFPPILLQLALKLTYESPPGLRENIVRTVAGWPKGLATGELGVSPSSPPSASGGGLKAQLTCGAALFSLCLFRFRLIFLLWIVMTRLRQTFVLQRIFFCFSFLSECLFSFFFFSIRVFVLIARGMPSGAHTQYPVYVLEQSIPSQVHAGLVPCRGARTPVIYPPRVDQVLRIFVGGFARGVGCSG
jgi:hypothetical protein